MHDVLENWSVVSLGLRGAPIFRMITTCLPPATPLGLMIFFLAWVEGILRSEGNLVLTKGANILEAALGEISCQTQVSFVNVSIQDLGPEKAFVNLDDPAIRNVNRGDSREPIRSKPEFFTRAPNRDSQTRGSVRQPSADSHESKRAPGLGVVGGLKILKLLLLKL